MDATEVSQGVDPKNVCRIEVLVNSYFSIINGKKVYNKGRTIFLVVDSEEYEIIDLEKDIAPHFTWSINQKANFWVVDSKMNLTCKLATNGQLLDLLRASQVVKFLMIVGAREEEHVVPVAADVVGEGMSAAGNMAEKCTSDAVDIVGEGKRVAAKVVEEEPKVEGFAWEEVPIYGETAAGPPMVEEEEKEHFMTFGCDPHGDEPAGVDEEWRYFKKVDDAAHGSKPTKNIEVHVKKRKRARPTPEFDPECVPDDEAGAVNDYFVPHTTHDPENPVIKEKDTFGDKEEFIQTMRLLR